jgi:hypothetical protein
MLEFTALANYELVTACKPISKSNVSKLRQCNLHFSVLEWVRHMLGPKLKRFTLIFVHKHAEVSAVLDRQDVKRCRVWLRFANHLVQRN